MNHPLLSPLSFADGFARGRVTGGAAGGSLLHLYIDGRHVATEYAGADGSFAFALPLAALDGFAHDVHVALPTADGHGVHGEVATFRTGAVCGEVRQQGRQFVGTVWFAKQPRSTARLQVTDGTGRRVHSQALRASRVADANGFPAAFTVACADVPPGDLVFTCAGQTLRGSPCARAQVLIGALDDVAQGRIKGWALDGADVASPLELVLRIDGQPVAWFRPNVRRPDIAAYLSLPPDALGLAGFDLPLPESLEDGRPHAIDVVSAMDGQFLKNGRQRVQIAPAGVAWQPPAMREIRAPLKAQSAVTRAVSPQVSVIILNRNGEGVLRAFLESWEAHNRTVAAEIIVVDHASTDGSLALLRAWRNRLALKVLALDHNGSFSDSSNLGARHARGQFLLFMNNDIVWLQDALPRLLASLDDPQVGVVGIKLLKAMGGNDGAPTATEVQHLGVRFKLNDRGYWPFEVTPSAQHGEAEHSSQYVPAVTGAVLLCRKTDFDAVGGFDPAYFYGFEDVELCLRLAYRLRKAVVCRNDCVALHRHGHTRLSGREMSIFDRVMRNSAVLASHIGVWIKQAYWRSLVTGDGYITRERLAVGIVVPRLADAQALAGPLGAALPHARIVLLPPGRDWKNVAGLHLLLVGDERYDVRSLANARADLLTLVWVRSRPVDDVVRDAVHALGADRWRLRVMIDDRSGNPARAHALAQRLQAQGLPCWTEKDTGRMADVCITIWQGARKPRDLADDVLNVVWSGEGDGPDAASLARQMEIRVGNTFRSP